MLFAAEKIKLSTILFSEDDEMPDVAAVRLSTVPSDN